MSQGGDTRWDRRTVLQALGAVGALGTTGVTAATPGRNPGRKEDELLVGVSTPDGLPSVESYVEDVTPAGGGVAHRNETLGYVAVELPSSADDRAREAVRSALENRSNVAYVEENATYETQVAPNDPQFDSQYAPQQVNADDAWEVTYGSDDVSIAVVDTGVQYDHPDLASRYGSGEGKDFVDDDGDPASEGGTHATHVSGCATATTDNDEGVTGVSNSHLFNARALDEDGGGSLSDIADAIQWAADQGADIINLSLGGGGDSSTMQNAVSYAHDQGSLIIAAAGNDGYWSVSYPAAYDECVAVSALNPDEELADFSNYGSAIEVAAPGVNVLSTYPTDDYKELSGTSMACPVAAGVAALGLAENPGLTNAELRSLLKDTAVDVGLSDSRQGAGRVDAANIVDAETDDGDDGGSEPDLYCGSASNSDHAAAGRAYTSWGDYYYYAEGSDDYLGTYGWYDSTLKETSEGYFEDVSSC